MSDDPKVREADILKVLFAALSRFPLKSAELTAQTSLTADLSLDSIAMMEVLVEVEDHYDISLPLNRMGDVTTVQDLADRINHILGHRT